MSEIWVRCVSRTVFPVDPVTLEAKNCGTYDAYCFSDPEPDVTYLTPEEWMRLRRTPRRSLGGARDVSHRVEGEEE